jgi:tripartite-type tricarboxylate transporter receptor subunit TctC
MLRIRFTALAIVLAAAAFSFAASAQDYPNLAVKIVVPFAPRVQRHARPAHRGAPDAAARPAGDRRKQGGAGSQIGIDFVAKSPPDGYNLV